MESIPTLLSQGVDQLVGRASGPLHLRLLIMPSVVAFLAFRAGLKDARERRKTFVWSILTDRIERRRRLRSALRHLGKIVLMAIIIDSCYQLLVLRGFHPIQLLIITVGCAIVPYVLIRGPVAYVRRAMGEQGPGQSDGPPPNTAPDARVSEQN